MRFVLTVLVNGVSLWLTTLILSGGIEVTAYDSTPLALLLTYALLGLVWGVVNSIIGGLIRTVGFCFYVITLGLIGLVVNGFLFWLVGEISGWLGFGLQVEGLWWAIGAGVLMSIFTAIIGGVLRPRREAGSER